jgi:hypothetical protein
LEKIDPPIFSQAAPWFVAAKNVFFAACSSA